MSNVIPFEAPVQINTPEHKIRLYHDGRVVYVDYDVGLDMELSRALQDDHTAQVIPFPVR